MSDTPQKFEVRVTVLGSGGVGKSALTVRLVTDNFIDQYDPTIEDSYRKNLFIDEKPVMLDILDTAGQEEFRSMRSKWMSEGDGFMLVFDVTKEITFAEVREMHTTILRNHPAKENVPLILVGNKIDMVKSGGSSRANIDAQELANTWKCKYLETSAKTGHNVHEVFGELVRTVRKHQAIPNARVRKKFCSIL